MSTCNMFLIILSQRQAMTKNNPTIRVEIEPGEPTPAQAAAWRELWAKLLSKGQKQAKAGQESDRKG